MLETPHYWLVKWTPQELCGILIDGNSGGNNMVVSHNPGHNPCHISQSLKAAVLVCFYCLTKHTCVIPSWIGVMLVWKTDHALSHNGHFDKESLSCVWRQLLWQHSAGLPLIQPPSASKHVTPGKGAQNFCGWYEFPYISAKSLSPLIRQHRSGLPP